MKIRLMLAVASVAFVTAACTHTIVPNGMPNRAADAAWRALDLTPPNVTEILSPNFDDRKGTPVTVIVLHHTAVTADATSTAHFFADPKSRVSAHYVVDRSGAIIRCVADSNRAWHAGKSQFDGVQDVNTFSVGIEIANVGDGVEPYPAPQVDAVVHLVAYLAQTFKVPMDHVTRHRDICIPVGRKQDTSNNFDQNYVKTAAQALIDGTTPPPPYRAKAAPRGYNPAIQTYTVKANDSYSSISDDVYDTPAMAAAIARLNPRVLLKSGAVLRMPTNYTP
jgi:N-acetyl-anhydromuramyl-L-alanine amidase AmpD